tara:strand:+ start:613 stop:879 length:267 start_codon:yes stop_codon:yes gene_type:complete
MECRKQRAASQSSNSKKEEVKGKDGGVEVWEWKDEEKKLEHIWGNMVVVAAGKAAAVRVEVSTLSKLCNVSRDNCLSGLSLERNDYDW